ncbi:MAG: hypothetical protein Q8O89_05390 [Nanoarchaeota archaeon]|nr:hypothetical protein [Nanoarchaeota archaeon]
MKEDKLKEVLDLFEYEELIRMREELHENVSFLKKEIDSRIEHIENNKDNICVTCGRKIKHDDHAIQLVFGPTNVKKKANFCAMDCLEYFIRKLRELDTKVDRGIIKDQNDLEKEFGDFDSLEF